MTRPPQAEAAEGEGEVGDDLVLRRAPRNLQAPQLLLRMSSLQIRLRESGMMPNGPVERVE